MCKFLQLKIAATLMLFTSIAWAQDRTVSGKVTSSDDGSPLPGVNVFIKGTTSGTVTNSDGNWQLLVSTDDQILIFSFIGMGTQEAIVGGRTVIDVKMTSDISQLSEVVITAQGIQQERKALGYAMSTVNSDQLEGRPVNDISRVLQGKLPGVVINPTGGVAGTGASINIRGYSSLTGSTQPLWVVDGVPFNSSTNNASGFTTGGSAITPSRFLDIDPNSIESINVLKGLSATVLYGDQGRNGVILVTTKSGSTKKRTTEFSIQQSTSISEIASWPKFQNEYGNGSQQIAGTSPTFYNNWGPHFSEIDSTGVPMQFISDPSIRDAYPEYYFKRYPYKASPNPLDFFRKGAVSNTSLTMSGGNDKLGFSTSVSYTREQGYTPGNDLKRLNITTGFNAAVTSKFFIRTTIFYTNTDLVTPPLNSATGNGASNGGIPSLYGQLLYTPINIDVLNWPFETPLDHKSIYYRPSNDIPNPKWIAKYLRETDVTDRFFNSTSLTYDFNSNMSLSYRVGLDTYTERQNREYNKGIGPVYPNVDRGILQTQSITNTIWNHDIIFSLNKQITSDISINSQFGANARNDKFLRDGIYSEQQTVFGLMRHSNFQTSSSRSIAFDGRTFYRTTEQQRYGVYANVSTSYKNFVFLNLAARNDWVSMLETGNNSQFYPSANVSFIPTDAFPGLKSNTISFLKLRLGYGTSAGFPTPYSTRTIVNQNLRSYVDNGGNIYGEHTISDFLGNAKLKPELQQEYEAGVEARLFDGRLRIDLTAYDRGTRNLINFTQLDPSTGYTQTATNVGKLSNKGIELGLSGTPLRFANGLEWNVIWNFTLVRPKVISLGDQLNEQVLSGFTTRGNYAISGQPTNIIKGSGILEDGSGNRVVGTDGLYVQAPDNKILGDPNPNYLTTLINSFSYKGITLSFQFDYRNGGKIYSSTASATLGRGVTQDLLKYDHDLTFVLPGVKIIGTNPDGSNIYSKNDIQVTATDYGYNTQFFGYNEVGMFDATNIRLREISLGYTLPKSLLSKTPIKSASIQFTGRNLWFRALNVPKYVNYDPEVAGSQGVDNGVGFDYLTGPSVRNYGAVLRLTF